MSCVPLWQILVNSFFGVTVQSSAHSSNLLERKDAIQKDLERLERWVCVNFMEFNKAKCKVFTPETWQSETHFQTGQKSD